MRVLFVTWAWPTHFYPLVPLAHALRAAGHEVRVATQPGLVERVSRAGLTAVSVGTDVDTVEVGRPFYTWVADQEKPVEWADIRANGAANLHMYVMHAEAMAEDTIAFGRVWRPHVIVHECTAYAGPIAAATLGVPAIRHIYGVDFPGQAHPFEGEALAGLTDRLGIGRIDTLGIATADPCPPSLQVDEPITRRLPMRYVPYNGTAVFPKWLNHPPERPRICVTWGTSSSVLTGDRLFLPPRLIAAARGLDLEIVVAVIPRDAAKLGRVPDNVRVCTSLALHLLMPSCTAVVHQGGCGTLLTAALYGVPQLACPQLPDQLFYTDQLAASGAGVVCRPDEAGDDAIRAGLMAVLGDPAYATAARRIREEMRAQPTAGATAHAMADLVNQNERSDPARPPARRR